VATAPRAPATAARWFSAALRLMPESGEAARLQTLTDLAQVLRSTGDLDRCVATLLEALELVPAGETRLRLTLSAACAAAENFLGRHAQSRRRLTTALESVSDPESQEAVSILLALVASAFFMLDVDDERAFARRALGAARSLEDPLLICAAASALAQSAANAGATAETRAGVDEAAAHLDAVTDETLRTRLPRLPRPRHLDAVNRLAWSEFLIERYDDAIEHAARGVAVARSTGQEQFGPLIIGAQALSTARRGDLAGATALQAEALETAEVAANAYVMCWVLTISAHVAMERGDCDEARRSAGQAVTLMSGLDDNRVAAMACARLAVTRRLMGDPAAGLDSLVRAAGGWDLTRIQPSWRVYYTAALTEAELHDGSDDDADAFAARAERTAEGLELPVATAMAQRARAAVRLAAGDAEMAAKLTLASADAAARAPIEAARSYALAGRALATAGERTRGVQLLRSAERTFDGCGAERDRQAARHQLRRLGARSEPRGPSTGADAGVASLTPREREIARLVTARKTNREIAAELFLSEKTIESHLRNTFVKLSVSSRVEVARAVEAAGELASDRTHP
jgi:ATP/maltotriose-dependent transcriptional regulator MalT